MTPPAAHSVAFEAIGTHWQIDVYEPLAAWAWEQLQGVITARIAQFDQRYSRFRSDSLVSRMATVAGTYELPPDARALFDVYRDFYNHTAGAMTPLIGQTLADAGYDAQYSLTPGVVVAPPAWDEVLQYEFPRLTLARPALLDVGAAGKGYLVDLVAAELEGAGITAYCVDAGGDLTYRRPSGEPLRVGLEHPADPSQVIGVAELAGGSLCGSSGNRRAWQAYHHVINPHTLASPRHLEALWVTADTTLLADALTTALYFVAPAALRSYYEFEYALMHADGSLEYSPRFPATFFTD